MKRSDVEAQIAKIHQDVKSQIEAAPVPAVLGAFILGVVFTTFKVYLFPIALLVIAATLVAWLVSEAPTQEELALNRSNSGAVSAAGISADLDAGIADDEDEEEERNGTGRKSRSKSTGTSGSRKKVGSSTRKSGSKTRVKTTKANGSSGKTTKTRKSTSSRSRSRSASSSR